MTKNRSIRPNSDRRGGTPLMLAMAAATLGVLGLLIVDHGPWNKPKVHTAEIANYTTTGEAARAAGAVVMRTDPKPPIEPAPAGPKPVHPASPSSPR